MAGVFQLENHDLDMLNIINDRYVKGGLIYGWKSSTKLSFDQGHWNKMIARNSKRFPCELAQSPYLSNHKEVLHFWDIICSTIGNRSLMRVYINGYTYGTDGYAHHDDSYINKIHGEDSLSETAIIYLNKDWDINWAGETVLFDKSEKEIAASILPKFGRVLVFDSRTLHAARPISRICNELRSVLVFKTLDPRIISEPVKFIQNNTLHLPHTKKTFFEHLFNTMRILEHRENSDDILLAGLFHSIYGTEYYKHDLVFPREKIKDLIGQYAEHLVYEFCNMKERYKTLMTNANNYSNNILYDLVEIAIANSIEQNVNNKSTERILELENFKNTIKRM